MRSRVRYNWLNDRIIIYIENNIFIDIENEKTIQIFHDIKNNRTIIISQCYKFLYMMSPQFKNYGFVAG